MFVSQALSQTTLFVLGASSLDVEVALMGSPAKGRVLSGPWPVTPSSLTRLQTRLYIYTFRRGGRENHVGLVHGLYI